MKKLLVIIGIAFLLCGCGSANKDDVVNEFKKDVNNSKSYKLSGTMEIMNDEESFVYNLETYYMKDDYYKVVLVNQTNNHEQIILKNNDEVYVITPELNKSFKFQSEWPNNSSQAYLLNSVLKDLIEDKDIELMDNEQKYVIKSKVNYPNNDELSYQKIYFDKDNNLEKVEVYDKNDIIKIKVMFDKIDLKANLSKSDFEIKEYIDTNEDNVCEEANCKQEENKTKTTENENNNNNNNNNAEITENNQTDQNNSNQNENDNQNTETNIENEENNTNNTQTSGFNLDSVIYPLYIPGETYLTNSETIKTEDGNRVILTFTGEKNFVIIEEMAVSEPTMKIIPVYGDPLMLSNSIGALTGNSLTWDSNNISYYLASTDLSTNEMLTIANSLGSTTMVAKEK